MNTSRASGKTPRSSAGGENRTRTPLSGPGILSPVRLPVPPPRRISLPYLIAQIRYDRATLIPHMRSSRVIRKPSSFRESIHWQHWARAMLFFPNGSRHRAVFSSVMKRASRLLHNRWFPPEPMSAPKNHAAAERLCGRSPSRGFHRRLRVRRRHYPGLVSARSGCGRAS
jgi:hypothetical protein